MRQEAADAGALALDTEVPSPGGWRVIADLQVGDKVFDELGRVTSVVAAGGVMAGCRCRRVTLSDGTFFVAGAQHLWCTTAKADRSHGHVQTCLRSTDDIGSTLRSGEEYNHQILLAGPVRYPTATLPIDPYVLGYWLGDGTSTKAEITIGTHDEPFVLGQLQAAGYATWRASGPRAFRVGGLRRGQAGRERDAGGRYCADDSLASQLRALRLLGNKHVPSAYLIADVGQRLALLQGLMDSDGYVDVYGRCEFVSIREGLSAAVAELAASLGLRPAQRRKRVTFRGVDHGVAYQVKFTPRQPVFRLPRKLARLKSDERSHSFRSVRGVEEVPSVPLRGIQVASASGMFLVGRRFVPTHDSSLRGYGAATPPVMRMTIARQRRYDLGTTVRCAKARVTLTHST